MKKINPIISRLENYGFLVRTEKKIPYEKLYKRYAALYLNIIDTNDKVDPKEFNK